MQELRCQLFKKMELQQQNGMYHLLLANLKICTVIFKYVPLTENDSIALKAFLFDIDRNAKEKCFRDELHTHYIEYFYKFFSLENKALAETFRSELRQEMPPTHFSDVYYTSFANTFHECLINNPDERYNKLKKEQAFRLSRLENAYQINKYSVFCEIIVPFLRSLRNESLQNIQNISIEAILNFLESLIFIVTYQHTDHKELWHYILPLIQILDLGAEDPFPSFKRYQDLESLKNWKGGHAEGILLLQHISNKIVKAKNSILQKKWVKKALQMNDHLMNVFPQEISCDLLKDNKTLLRENRKVFEKKELVAAQQAFNQFSVELLNTFITHMAFLLGPTPCDFAFCILGSTSRSDQRPYSDVELLFLYQPFDYIRQERLHTYIYQLICGVELAIKCLGEAHSENSALCQNAGFHIDSSSHLLSKQLFDTPENIANKFIINSAKNANKNFHPWIEDEYFYSFLQPKAINQGLFGCESVIQSYQDKINTFLSEPLSAQDNPEILSSVLALSSAKDLSDLSRSQIIALACLRDVVQKSKDILSVLRIGEIVDIKNAFYKPLTYLALNFKLYYGLHSTHPIDILSEISQTISIDAPIIELLQTAYRYVSTLQVRLHRKAGYQEEEILWMEKNEKLLQTTLLSLEEYSGLELIKDAIILPLWNLCEKVLNNPKKEMKEILPLLWDDYIEYRQEFYDKWINQQEDIQDPLFSHVLIALSSHYPSKNGWCPYYEEEIWNVLNKNILLLLKKETWQNLNTIFQCFPYNGDFLIKREATDSSLRRKFLCWLLKRITEKKEINKAPVLHRIFLLKQKSAEHHIEQSLSPYFEFAHIITAYLHTIFYSCITTEDYENWFIDVTNYLLYTQDLLETHRYYYRQLPSEYRRLCLVTAKNYFENQRYFACWCTEETFWIKLWDAPLSNGERFSYQKHKENWALKLNTLLTSNEEVAKSSGLRVYIHGIKAGEFGLNPVIASALLQKGWINQQGKFVLKNDHSLASRLPGNHLVIPWPLPDEDIISVILSEYHTKNKSDKKINRELLEAVQANAQFYFKVYPEYPLVELFLIELSYHLGYYPPREADVWLWKSEKYDYPVLISEAVKGKTFQKMLENDVALQLNPQAFSESVLLSGVASLEDNKPDNLLLSPTEAGQRLCLIDADRWFAPAFKGNQLHAKNVVFCLPHMASEIDPVFREEILSLNPQHLLQSWIDTIESMGKACNTIFEGKINVYFNRTDLYSYQHDDARRTLLLPPLPFHTVNQLFQNLQNIQNLLSTSVVKVSHSHLLSKINTRLANHYSLARKNHPKPLACFQYTAGHGYLKGKGLQEEYYSSLINFVTDRQDIWGKEEELKRAKISIEKNWEQDINIAKEQLSKLHEKEEVIKAAESELLKGNFVPFLHLGSNGKEKILENLDWSILSLTKQRELLHHLMNPGHWLRLCIKNCKAIKDEDLQLLIQKSPLLKKLQLINCPQLTAEFWTGILNYDSHLTIILLKNLKNLCYIGYIGFIFEQCLEFPFLEKLEIKDCLALEEIYIHAPMLKVIHLDNISKLTRLESQSESLENLRLTGSTPLLSLEEFHKVMNKTYAEKLNFFEWGRQDALILFKQLPALLGIDYGKNKYQITLKFIQNLTKILSKKEIRYLEINYTSRKELILSIENLYEKFVNFEEKKIKSSMHLSKCWRITNGESGYRLLLRSSN